MDRDLLWQLFWDTGAPEAYMLYSRACKTEELHVFDDQGSGASGISLQ